MTLCPITITIAKAFVTENHRHNKAPVGAKFAIGLQDNASLVGVVLVGRPVARRLDDGFTAEVTRCCVADGYPNACSMLYAAAWRCARAMGYRKIITYTLGSEAGVSVQAAGWLRVAVTRGESWDRPSRSRKDNHPLEPKVRWEQLTGKSATVVNLMPKSL